MNKNKLIYGLATSMLVSQMLLAQGAVVPIIPMGGGTGTNIVNSNGGDFNFTNQNITQSIDTTTRQIFMARKEDKEYLEAQINQLEAMLNHIQRDIINNKLLKMSLESKTGIFPAITELTGLQIDLANSKVTIDNRLQSLAAMSSGALPSTEIALTDKKTVTVPAYKDIKLDRVIGDYKIRIEKLDEQINKNTVTFKDKANIQHTYSLNNIDYSKITLFSATEIAQMQAEIDEKNTIPASLKSKQDVSTLKLGRLMYDFIIETGTEERWRFLNEDDKKAHQERYNRIVEAFFYRSYLRQKYGVNYGIIGVKFEKRFANIEKFLMSPWDFVQFFELQKDNQGKVYIDPATKRPVIVKQMMTVRAQRQIESVKESFRNLMETSEEKSASIFDGKTSLLSKAMALFTGEVNILKKANSAITYFTGYRPMMEAVTGVLRLMAADINEELILVSSASGHQQMREYFKSRYLSTSDSKMKTLAMNCSFDYVAVTESCNRAGINQSATDAVRKSGSNYISDMMNVLRETDNIAVNWGQAKVMQAQLDLNKSRNNTVNKQLNKETNDLYQ